MAEDDKSSKTLPATQHKLLKAREDGNMPRAKEFSSYFLLIVMIPFLWFLGSLGVEQLMRFTHYSLRRLSEHHLNAMTAVERFTESAIAAGSVLLPLFLFMLIVAIFGSVFMQGGWNVSFKPFEFKIDKFNPLKGLKKILASPDAWVQLARAIVMVFGLAIYTYFALSGIYRKLPGLQMMPIDMALKFTFDFVFDTLFKFMLLLIILALIDMAWTKYRYKEKLKMSVKERKDEQKNIEGDPQIKRRIRSVQMQAHRRRMMASVPEADVVVTNPVHYAVALRYDLEKSPAPQVIAKGQGYLAHRIKDLATEHDVPIVENPPLAQTLYKTVEIGDAVPPDLYKAVAKVLAYVYKLKGKIPA